jgi:hypothetical protein
VSPASCGPTQIAIWGDLEKSDSICPGKGGKTDVDVTSEFSNE